MGSNTFDTHRPILTSPYPIQSILTPVFSINSLPLPKLQHHPDRGKDDKKEKKEEEEEGEREGEEGGGSESLSSH